MGHQQADVENHWSKYLFGDGFREGEEGHGNEKIKGPVDGRCNRVTETPGPHRIDLGVDGPRHRAHAGREEEEVGAQAEDDQPRHVGGAVVGGKV